ncbi:enoyl-CoA hydratase [Vibrio algicola]|uniref:Enoyl-CoA hydratase n=1 Tax=Vibrio algicola TaxID=2662262 RepID=A0A5Q0TC79_9VIBR|nr:enoyl-CoA hydratase [Vibrio algicola]
MNKIYIAFYCGRKKIDSPIALLYRFIDFMIRVVTWGKFSHCELAVKTTNGYLCYSSSGRDGGVRQKIIDIKTDNWRLVDVTNTANLNDINHYFHLTNEGKYDYFGALGAVLPFIKCKRRYFCSEWVYNALKYSMQNPSEDGSRFSPNDLWIMYGKVEKH